MSKKLLLIMTMLVCFAMATAQTKPTKPRARDLGIPFDGTPSALNAITDVAGVEVGQVTLISGDGKLVTGKGPVRTGVTAPKLATGLQALECHLGPRGAVLQIVDDLHSGERAEEFTGFFG